MEVIVLGCGTNIPDLKKAGPSFYVKDGKDSILLDMGPGSLRNMLKAGLDKNKIENIIFSHLHLDHCADFLAFLFNRVFAITVQGKKMPKLKVFGPKGFSRFFKSVITKFPAIPKILPNIKTADIWNSQAKITGFKIKTATVIHVGEIKAMAIRLESVGKSIVYTGDTGICKTLPKILKDADLAIMECAFPKNIEKDGHLNTHQLGKLAEEAGVKKVVLTHLYPEAEKVDVKKEVKEKFTGEVILARDLLKIKI